MNFIPKVIKQGATHIGRINVLEQTEKAVLLAIRLDRKHVTVERELRKEGIVFILRTIDTEDAEWTDEFREAYIADRTEILFESEEFDYSWHPFTYDIGNKDELWITFYDIKCGGI